MPRRSDARAAVAESLTRRRAALERAVRRRFPDIDAREVYQRTAIRALERADDVRDLERVDAWVGRVAMTCALDLLRGARLREISTPDPPDVPAPIEEGTCACTLALLSTLPASYADVLRRVDIEGASLAEIADTLHIGKGNATVRLHRARNALRGRLRDHCGVETMRECFTCICAERGCCTTT